MCTMAAFSATLTMHVKFLLLLLGGTRLVSGLTASTKLKVGYHCQVVGK
jgi:hypothetical protein